MGARLGTVAGWQRISGSTDEPRQYEGTGGSNIIYPKYTGDEITEYWVRFNLDLYFCDSPPISPIVVRTLNDILIIQKFIELPIPDLDKWVKKVTETESTDIYRMSIEEMAGLRECGDPDNYTITITGQGKTELIESKLLETEELKKIQEERDRKLLKEKEKIKREKLEIESTIELVKKQAKIYKEMKKEPKPPISKEISDQMIDYYEKREKELLKTQERNKKTELRKIKKIEKEVRKEKEEEIKAIEKGIPIPEPIKKELSTMDVIQISKLAKSIIELEKQKEEQQKYLNITLAAINRIEESGKAELLLGQVVTRDRWIDEMNRTIRKIEKQQEAIEKIKSGIS